MPAVMCQCGGGPNGCASTSAPVKTWTFGSSSAADASIGVHARVRERRADERDGERALELEVLDVQALAAEKSRILQPHDAVAEDAHVERP